MRAVVDTNVLVSGLMRLGTAPARVLDMLLLGRLGWVYDERILQEYREVLARDKFRQVIDPGEVRDILNVLERTGLYVLNPPPLPSCFAVQPDRGDLPFIEVALAASADCIVTGNIRHFLAVPERVGVFTPAQCLERLCA